MLRLSFVSFIVLSFFMVGCSGKQSSNSVEKPGALPSGYLVNNVLVNIDELKLAEDRITSAKKYEINSRLESGVTTLLQEGSHFDAAKGDITLHITLTDFRLRSGASALWLGVMAGADRLAVDVSVSQQGKIVKTFQTDTSTVLGGLALPAPSQRINRMAKTLSTRIVSGL